MYVAPFDVRLTRFSLLKNKDVTTVVQPDLCVILVWKLNEQGFYIGLPPTVEGDILQTPIIPNLEVVVTDVFLD